MQRIFSNSPSGDYVINPYRKMVASAKVIWVAAPYVTATDELLLAQKEGKEIRLIVVLNDCTSPKALAQVHGLPNFGLRYFTRRFHAKLYVFDDEALLGSSNLTQGGLSLNREATIRLDAEAELDELRALFSELWEDASELTSEKLTSFTKAWTGRRGAQDPDPFIEGAVGKAEPQNGAVTSRKRSGESLFLESLRRQISEYGAAYREINDVLTASNVGRVELNTVGPAHRTNRFLNWVRLSQAPGEDAWKSAPIRSTDDRRGLIAQLGREWMSLPTDSTQNPEEYLDWLSKVLETFSSKDAIGDNSKETLMEGLISLHAFYEQSRFVEGGLKNLPAAFWDANGDDVDKVRRSLAQLLYGKGEFVVRLNDYLSLPELKLGYFGKFCALELFGTVNPELCPPMNGRTAKAMRFFRCLGLRGRRYGLDGVVAGVLGGMAGLVGSHRVIPPLLNGCSVFAFKHALALAHASRGGKCKRRGSPSLKRKRQLERRGRSAAEVCTSEAGPQRVLLPAGVMKRGRLGCLLHAPGTESIRELVFLVLRGARGDCIRVGVAGRNGPVRGGGRKTAALCRLQQGGRPRPCNILRCLCLLRVRGYRRE
jgi:hypothetical protein